MSDRQDIYGEIDKTKKSEENPAIPAATVVLLRDSNSGPEVLMLQKNKDIAFGGMWVFPGGRIDDEDHDDSGEILNAARNAAAREAEEETGLILDHGEFIWFSHWTPPASTPKRYSTWFFAAALDSDDEITVDGGEILDHRWITPEHAFELHAERKIDLAPPTWLTLYQMSKEASARDVIERLEGEEPKIYQTRLAKTGDGVRIAMWEEDAGWETWNADVEGERHRLLLHESGFEFESTIVKY